MHAGILKKLKKEKDSIVQSSKNESVVELHRKVEKKRRRRRERGGERRKALRKEYRDAAAGEGVGR